MRKIIAAACLVGALATYAVADSDRAKLDERLDSATRVITALRNVPDNGIPDKITQEAVCVLVIPSLKKGAFVVGGSYGQGVATCRTGHGWSAPVFVRISGASFGFQLGGQSTDLVLVAVNDRGMQDLLKSKVKLGGDASAAAGPVGRDSQAATSANMGAELLTYSRSKGLFAGIDLSGDVIDQNGDDTRTFYGSDIPFQSILHGSTPVPPGAARRFVSTVAHYFRSVQ
jgi:lipid-binding SYLF domain-containing protein